MLKLKSYFVIGITISTCIPYANTIANSNVKGSKIHITSKANSFLDQNPSQKKIIINGIVRDAQQEPLIGVNIRIKGTGDGTISDLTYIIHSGFISGYQNRYGDNLKPPTNVYHRMTA